MKQLIAQFPLLIFLTCAPTLASGPSHFLQPGEHVTLELKAISGKNVREGQASLRLFGLSRYPHPYALAHRVGYRSREWPYAHLGFTPLISVAAGIDSQPSSNSTQSYEIEISYDQTLPVQGHHQRGEVGVGIETYKFWSSEEVYLIIDLESLRRTHNQTLTLTSNKGYQVTVEVSLRD